MSEKLEIMFFQRRPFSGNSSIENSTSRLELITSPIFNPDFLRTKLNKYLDCCV
jgi:hypothetical protein